MSLPDTVFIFVLALIIFGPKKLPEIGRQLGRLVGEFRRASNEFKYQIEEELRQVEFAEKRSAPSTISQPASEPVEPLSSVNSGAVLPESADLAENIPVGQYPNIDTVDTSELNSTPVPPFGMNGSDQGLENPEFTGENSGNEVDPESGTSSPIAISPAPGSQPRTTVPFTDSVPTTPSFGQEIPEPPSEEAASSDRDSAPTEAEVTHG